jgi:hypothetical protein
MYAFLWIILNLLIGLYALIVLRFPRNKWVVGVYTVLLFIFGFLFLGIAFMGPKETTWAQEYINNNCTNSTSYIHLVDEIYTTANTVLCSATCPCYAGDLTFPHFF